MFKIFKELIHRRYKRRWKKISRNPNSEPRLLWGTEAVLNYSIWSNIMSENFTSKSIVYKSYEINNSSDFDYVLSEMKFSYYNRENFVTKYFNFLLRDYLIFDFLIKNFDIFFINYQGINVLGKDKWIEEIDILKQAGVKIVMLPYGADWIRMSIYNGFSFKHGYLTHYPHQSRIEDKIDFKMRYLNHNSDVIVAGGMLWGKIWDVLSCNYISIDINKFNAKKLIKEKETFNIVHSPNNRYLKGTEFVIKAVESLKEEGFKINLILLEKVKNDEVLRILNEDADLLIEQLLNGYALSGIEGMAAGIPVLSNLEDEEMCRKVFRRFSYLNECPILSTTPETIKENIKILYLNPELRSELGSASREYVEKYHSIKGTRYMFSKIIEKIWYAKEVDLMNMYHPLHPDSYNNKSPIIEHPLIENKIPIELLMTLKREL